MALQQNFDTPFGFTHNNAYCRVEAPNVLDKTLLRFHLVIYADQTKVSMTAIPHECSYSLNGGNVYMQAYEYLKTLPEFSDATDI